MTTLSASVGPVVLVVEDDPSQRLLLHEILTDLLGCEPQEAADGPAALAALAECRPDLVLLHHFLPPDGGLTLLRALRADARWAHLPVLMMSSFGLSPDRACAEALPPARWLTKPYDLDDLESAVRALLAEQSN